MSVLTYRPYAERGALDLDECTIAPVATGAGVAWMMHFYVRTTDGDEQTFRVPVNPHGPPVENGPLGRTWGLTRSTPGSWQISPSIDFGNWHQTPMIVGVPEGEPWIGGAP